MLRAGLLVLLLPVAMLSAAPQAQSVSLVDAPTLGDPNAPVVMIEFGDFHCPFCRQYVKETFPRVKKGYVDTGRVRYGFRNFPLQSHPRAPEAAVAGICAARAGKFWELHHRLFNAPRPVQPDDLEDHARAVGVDRSRFRICVKAGVARDDVRKDIEDARRLGLVGTPGFVFGYRDGEDRARPMRSMSGARPFEAIAAVLDGLLAGHGAGAPHERAGGSGGAKPPR